MQIGSLLPWVSNAAICDLDGILKLISVVLAPKNLTKVAATKGIKSSELLVQPRNRLLGVRARLHLLDLCELACPSAVILVFYAILLRVSLIHAVLLTQIAYLRIPLLWCKLAL